MAFLVAALDDFLVAATDDFLVTADDTVPGTGAGFDNVTVGSTIATWARLGSADLSSARVGSAVIWEEVVAPAMQPLTAGVDLSGFAPTLTVSSAIAVYPGSASMAVSGLVPTIEIAAGASSVTYMAPGGVALTASTAGAALPMAAGGISFVFDY